MASENSVTLVGNLTRDADLDLAIGVTRFWSCVSPPGEGGCRDWLGDTDADGYGVFVLLGRKWAAHELALTLGTGERRLSTLETCHSCHRPICVEPSHLRFGTRQSNVDDAVRAGRHVLGQANGRSKVTEADVLVIRQRAAAGAPFRVLAEEYGLGVSGVSAICSGRNWKHVGGPTIKRPPGARSRVNTKARRAAV